MLLVFLATGCTEVPFADLTDCEEVVATDASWPVSPVAVEGSWEVQVRGADRPLHLAIDEAVWKDEAWRRFGSSSGDCAAASWSLPTRSLQADLVLSDLPFDTIDMMIEPIDEPWWRAAVSSTDPITGEHPAIDATFVALAPDTVGRDRTLTSLRLTIEGRLGEDTALVDGQVTVEGSDDRATFRPEGTAVRLVE